MTAGNTNEPDQAVGVYVSHGDARRLLGRIAFVVFLAVSSVVSPAAAREPIACFKPGAELSPGVEESLAQIEQARASGPSAAFAESRWLSTAWDADAGPKGSRLRVTWGVVPDGTPIEGYYSGESTENSTLRAWLDGLYGDEATWLALFADAFDSWEEIAGVDFIYEPADDGSGFWRERLGAANVSLPGEVGVRADIRIAAHPVDGNFSIVAYALGPDNGDIVFDSGDEFFDPDANGDAELLFRNTLAHEVGHSMGLEHVCPVSGSGSRTKLMEPSIVSDFDGPQHDDLIAMQENYGDVREDDDSDVDALDFGRGAPFLSAMQDLSIDGSSDEDWIVVPDEPWLTLDVSLQPYGESYLIANSSSSGSCSGVTPVLVDTSASQDLAVQVLAADGSTEIAFADANAAGGNELLTGIAVPGGGFVRVIGDAGAAPQVYDLTVQFVPEPGATTSAMAALGVLACLARCGVPRPRRQPSA